MLKTIWVLFSIANDYDQPENNLEAWWYEKPTFSMLAKLWNIDVDLKVGNPIIGMILKEQEVRWNETDYRLREVKEGILI